RIQIGSRIHGMSRPLVNHAIKVAHIGWRSGIGILIIGDLHPLPEEVAVIVPECIVSIDTEHVIKKTGIKSNGIPEQITAVILVVISVSKGTQRSCSAPC